MDYARKDLAGLNVYVAKAQVVVPMDPLAGKTAQAKTGEPTETDLAVAAYMDLDVADLKKYVVTVIYRYLDCGDLHMGLPGSVVKNAAMSTSWHFLANVGFCPSCHQIQSFKI